MDNQEKIVFIYDMERLRAAERNLPPEQRQRFLDWASGFFACYDTFKDDNEKKVSA